MNSFSLSFTEDYDRDPQLVASLDTRGFKVRCLYWCSSIEFADLASALNKYPITHDAPIAGRWYQDCITLRIEPIDSAGHLAIRVALREFGSDWNICQSQFQASYGDLDRFREQLEAAISIGTGDAVLAST